MADDGVITAYLNELGGLLAKYRHRERVLNEVGDHLRERVDMLVAAGSDVREASNAAVRAFGDPKSYAESFRAISSMPTPFTRWSGLAGLCGPFLWIVFAVSWEALGDEGNAPWLLIAPFLMMVSGLVGIIVRTRGSFGRLRGWTASILIIGAVASLAVTGGYGMGGVYFSVAVLAGLTLLLQSTFRVGALPRPATLTIAVAGVALVALIGSDIKEQSAPVYVAGIALFLGWCWLQYTLWSESKSRRRAA